MREGPLLAVWALLTVALIVLVLVRAEQRAVDDDARRDAHGQVHRVVQLTAGRPGNGEPAP